MPGAPTSIGPFQIERELGRGGMGVVYLARDTRLDRMVAIKALPDHLVDDPDRLARFQREAKTLASLNHPNIASIYGLEAHERHQYLVLEYVEGQTLADALKRGPIAVHESVAIAKQVAEALEAAHEKGVVHRDLKPGNIMITPDGVAKVLDFGLARTTEGSPSSTSYPMHTQSPTVTSPAPVHSPTIAGAIMGTAGYMSPEQARGKPVDKRSDIFSFGCVLYEMLTGARPFQGETVADALGATIHKELNLGLLPPGTPVSVRTLLRRCLAKDRAHRLRDIGDARLELQSAGADEAPVGGVVRKRTVWPWVVAAVSMALAIGALAWPRPSHPAVAASAPEVVKFSIAGPPSTGNRRSVAVLMAPDGRTLAYADEERSIWVRRMDQLEARKLELPWEAELHCWTPDSRSLIVRSAGNRPTSELFRIGMDDPTPRLICAVPADGFLWRASVTPVDDDTLMLGMSNGGLWTVPIRGGTPAQVMPAGPDESTVTPSSIPGTGAVVFMEVTKGRVEMFAAGKRTVLFDFEGDRLNHVEYSRSGHLLVGVFEGNRSSGIWAIPFSADRLEVTGPPFLILPSGLFSVSRTGTMAFSPTPEVISRPHELVWVDRTGEVRATLGEPLLDAQNPSVSPSMDRIAVAAVADAMAGDARLDIFIVDARNGSRYQLFDDMGNDRFPQWRSDGASIVFSTWNSGIRLGRERDAEGQDAPRELTRRFLHGQPSTDNRYLMVYFTSLDYLEEGSDERKVFVDELAGQFDLTSDSRFVAYASGANTGVRLRRFPAGGGLIAVSKLDGTGLRWSRDNTELYFWAGDDFMAVPIDLTGPQPVVGAAQKLFSATPKRLIPGDNYDVGPEGRFLMIRDVSDAPDEPVPTEIQVIQNWPAEFANDMAGGGAGQQ